MLTLCFALLAPALAPALAQEAAAPAPALPETVEEAIRAYTLSQSPVRAGPYSASLGPLSIKRLITRVDLPPDQLSLTRLSPTRVAAQVNLVAKVNGPNRPFIVTADLAVIEETCQGYLLPVTVPASVTIDLSEGAGGVRARLTLGGLALDQVPAAQSLVFCDASTGGALVGAAVAWIEASAGYILQTYEDGLNGYLAGLPHLRLTAPPQPPSAAPPAAASEPALPWEEYGESLNE